MFDLQYILFRTHVAQVSTMHEIMRMHIDFQSWRQSVLAKSQACQREAEMLALNGWKS